MNGVFLIDKPSGMSSFDVLRELRRKFLERKMGYLGTLDPLATGLLVVFAGKATALIPYLKETEKEYVVELELGKSSDTYDITGSVEERSCDDVKEESFVKALEPFIGDIWQTQPAYSALKVQGKRAYELARAGKEVNLGKRQVSIHEIALLSFEFPVVQLRVRCSSGTYIRSLVHELGQALDCGAVMTELRRTKVGKFELGMASQLDLVAAKDLMKPDQVAAEFVDWHGRASREKELLCRKMA